MKVGEAKAVEKAAEKAAVTAVATVEERAVATAAVAREAEARGHL